MKLKIQRAKLKVTIQKLKLSVHWRVRFNFEFYIFTYL